MRCTEIRKLISLYIDDRLISDEKKIFDSHILNCSECREALEETQTIHQLLTSTEKFSAPYGFSTRVMANLEMKEPSWLWTFFTFRPLVLRTMEVAFAIIVAMIGLLSGNVLTADRVSPQNSVTIQESFSLDLFQAAPPDSIGGAYVALTEASHER